MIIKYSILKIQGIKLYEIAKYPVFFYHTRGKDRILDTQNVDVIDNYQCKNKFLEKRKTIK